MTLHGETRYADYNEYVLSMLAKACSADEIPWDRTLKLYERMQAEFSRRMRKDPSMRERLASAFLNDRKEAVMLRNTRGWFSLVKTMREVADPHGLDMVFMMSYLVLYEGMYALTIDRLYEVLSDDDSKQCDACGRKQRLGTSGRAKKLAGFGIDVRRDVPHGIRNAAAHMSYNATGGAVDTPNGILMSNGDAFERNESDAELYLDVSGGRLKDAGDTFQRAREAVMSLFWAAQHLYSVHGGPWRLFGREFFRTEIGIGIMERAVGRMLQEEFEDWPHTVKEAERELSVEIGRTC